MKAVRIVRSNWLNDWIAGDAGALRFLTDEQAYDAVEVHHIAVYDPRYDPPSDAQEIPVRHVPAEQSVEFPDTPQVITFEPAVPYEPVGRDDRLDHIEAVADGHPEDSPLAEMKQPWSTHSKAKWIEWAVHQGADPDEAAAQSKTQLMSRYGERL